MAAGFESWLSVTGLVTLNKHFNIFETHQENRKKMELNLWILVRLK